MKDMLEETMLVITFYPSYFFMHILHFYLLQGIKWRFKIYFLSSIE